MYLILVDRLERQTLADRQVVGAAMVAGAKGEDGRPLQLPDVEEERRLFDERLAAPFGHERAKQRLLEELGLAS